MQQHTREEYTPQPLPWAFKKKMKANCGMNNAEACRMQMQDTQDLF